MEVIEKQFRRQQEYFNEIRNISIESRISALKKLKSGLKKYESDIELALKSDLGKPAFEAFTAEIGFLYLSINYTVKHLRKWAKVRRVRSEMAQVVGTSHIYPSAYGIVLIIGPFNYPVQLLLEPLIGAIAGGNVAVLKPSELTPNVEIVMKRLMTELFDDRYVSVVTGNAKVSASLLSLPFDYIFFTGSVRVGKLVMQKASEHLTPLTLELGGKSPVIVDESANLILAAKRVVWGKFINAGQTCVAPDYVLVQESVYESFLNEVQKVIQQYYSESPKDSPDFGRIVSREHCARLARLIADNQVKIVVGGEVDVTLRYVEPTVFKEVTLADSLMEEELFGPLLPTMIYRSIEDIDQYLQAHPKPLALYIFSNNRTFSELILRRYSFGGGCVNDTITHVGSFKLPFGGVGPSGIGRYHGEASFKTFTYEKAIVKRSTRVSTSWLLPPYKNKLNLIKKVIK